MVRRLSLFLMCGLLGFAGAALHEAVRSPIVNAGTTTPVWGAGRGFYLTKTAVQGNAALTACASGYHMASLWEIHEPSNLKYNTTLGQTSDDSGSGPPVYIPGVVEPGWVRTGSKSWNLSTALPGQANCAAWTDNSSTDNGSAVYLFQEWSYGGGVGKTPSEELPWYPSTPNGNAYPPTCNGALPVWCVEN